MNPCAWCGAPATTTVVLEPARMGTITHPMLGPQRAVVKRQIDAAACAICARKATETPRKRHTDPRSVAAPDRQTDIYDHLGETP